jgi:glutamate dehydrogenase
MITADPQKKANTLSQVVAILSRISPAEDLERVLSFAPVVFAETPDRIALTLPPEALAQRILGHFGFIAHEMPPPTQVYKGVPGIHVGVRNPSESEALATGGGKGLPIETTIVETHTMDAPFIFESLKNYFIKSGLRVFSAVHPIFSVRRQWERVAWIGGPREEGWKEVYCHFQIERVDSKERLRRIEHEIFSVLKCVFLAVEDFDEMVGIEADMAARLCSPVGDAGEVESARAFLEWLAADNYIFMGTARYILDADRLPRRLRESATGIFKDEALLPVVFPGLVEEIERHILPVGGDRRIVGLDYCENASAIYHLEPIDYVMLRDWALDGTLKGVTLLLGRFARSAFSQRADSIPLLKEKANWILAESGQIRNSHVYREIRSTFNSMPMRELFYAPAPSLKEIIEQIVFMMSDDALVVHSRVGERYVVLTIAFSRSHYSYDAETGLVQRFSETFGPISFHTMAECGTLTLLLFYFDADKLDHPVEVDAVRRITLPLVTTWERRVLAELEGAFGESEGRRLFSRYVRADSRSGLYREVTAPELVPEDLRRLESLEGRLEVRVLPKSLDTATLHLYSERPLGLTDALRTLQNLGLSVNEELRVPLTLPEERKCYLYRLEIEAPQKRIAALEIAGDRFVEALRALDEERASDDPLNGLILDASLTWREVALIRTLRNHLLQIRPYYNAETINGVVLRNSSVARALFLAFAERFDPARDSGRDAAIKEGDKGVQAALETVRSLMEDEVLRALDNLSRSTIRTNYYQTPERPVIAIKVDSRKVAGMPAPRPLCEIYVHSRLLEGIHLRGGRVARGGIRWSDRHDDFRTEILGLMKTQMIKNSVIIPVGSKGGFVLKGNIPTRPALDTYLIDRYREYVSGLLDLTDNIVGGQVLHPPEVVRYDDGDPYLVVAADKGTAHLSDTANSVSSQYGFWLGDAFASGGSHGYDHKAVGITARGTWECVKHHFRNLGIDVQRDPFTVCAIGDMAGDVFGNGMLMSRKIRLLAAFNHAHIFIDPDPDMERSCLERERLFQLSRSSWRDYDVSLLSAGGGIFDRSAKAIPVSAAMGKMLDIDTPLTTGEELIRKILSARVDLLYNGGIGTYVKSSSEEHADVRDHSNDRVRINGVEVRARVVAEGGNLGFTQKGRIEYWLHGGIMNTDAVDNSGGVDMSDHEVNIKIFLDVLEREGVIAGKEERNLILAEMTEEVAQLVLADNECQSRALTLDAMRSIARFEEFMNVIEEMVAMGAVNRSDADLPARDKLLEASQQGRGLPRPLLAVLLAHSKMWAYEAALQSTFPESGMGMEFLRCYFPERLRRDYSRHFEKHVLRREIAATGAVNYVLNNAGMLLIPRLRNAAKTGVGEVLAAYLNIDRQADAEKLRREIKASALSAAIEHQHLLEVEEVIESAAGDALCGLPPGDVAGRLNPIRAACRAHGQGGSQSSE